MKRILAVIFTVFSLYSVFADDGGSYYPEEWTYGNIYVKEPNDKIALERELLFVGQGYFYGKSITALFDFKNTTSEKVTVPCAFPVIVSTQVAINKDGYISNYIPIGNGYRSKIDLINLALGKINATKEEFFAIDKKLRTLSIDGYISEMKNNQITDPTLQPCVIEQDGKNVSVLMVGIETSIEKDIEASESVKNSSWSEADEVYTLKLVLHFYHELVFTPSVSSKLTVKYNIDTGIGGYRGSKYNFIYDISTGGTWKGNINDFIVLTDSSMTPHNSDANFEVTGFYEPLVFYITKNYKPQKNEFFEFKLNYEPDDYSGSIFQIPSVKNEENLSFVTNVKASSELEGTYKMAGKPDPWNNEENLDKNLRTSTYKANTSFDGILFNGWVEGVKGDGIGEWIEFTLTKNVIGPFATNGLRRFNGAYKEKEDDYRYDSWDFVFSKINFIGEPWISNNRIKSMTLFDSSRKTNIKLDFADIFPIFNGDYSSDLENINSIKNPVFLEKGTYKMQIDSVYKGRKWDDTVLGEVWFIPVPEKLSQILENDTDLFFKKPITDIIQKSVLSSIEISERQTEESFLGVTYPYDDFYYAINAKNEITITGYNIFYSSTLDIPSTIEGKIVTTIGKSAFEDCSLLTSITIPNSVTTIGVDAFENCDSLTSITIPNSVTTIGESAFSSCDSLTSITIPNSVTTIGESAFRSCDSLISITIPNSVTTIGNSAFYDCDSLTSITIPDSVTTIGNSAFSSCDSLTSITIPDSVTTIGDYAFYDCVSLTSITIPDSVTTIGDYAFYDCVSLTSIIIPNSVISIGDDAFVDCESITIQCNPGSYAEKYCKDNNLKCFIISD